MIHRELCSVWKYYYYVNVFKNILSAKFSSVESLFSLIWRIKRKSKFLRVTKRSRFFEKEIERGYRLVIAE